MGLFDDLVPRQKKDAQYSFGKRHENGEIMVINEEEYLGVLPLRLKDLIIELGYVPKFYNYPAVYFASIMETCISDNLNRGSILAYNSSVKKGDKLIERLRYYAVIHSGENDGPDMGVIVIYEYDKIKNSSLILLSAADIMKYSLWVEKISEGMSREIRGVEQRNGDAGM